MSDFPEGGLATRCIHAGEAADPHGSPHTPVYTTTTFAFPDTAAILDVVEGRAAGSLYTRYGLNPTIQALEAKLASLEGAGAALAFASGMAAEAAAFMAHGRGGVVCIGDAYGGSLELIGDQLPQLGIPTHLLLGGELERLDPLLAAGAGLVFLETPTNPALEVFDIAALAARAHAHGALLMVDNTFASPVNQQPLALGADLVVHSATKYLGGHSDLTAGALMGSPELMEGVWPWRKNLGQTPAPETAALLARSLRTLVVRVRAQNASARAIARALEGHPGVTRVLYPGLASFPGHELAARQMTGFGGMLTIEVAGDGAAAAAVADRLRLFAIAPSLGGVESLVTQPVTTTHHGLGPEERRRRGISDAMLRLSVGLEDVEDLIADLEQALG
ncbi:MAG: aminotransferase class I/II-fold pyridoxal phosphate-dependent enzyme [Gammaproteobacteria bacterium]|nr:aminotransferase class I/II-fold pyridoxal phosphate-dependent enzyme [Gammaproteobacteria bacterium]